MENNFKTTFDIPVVIIIFNRVETTNKLLQILSQLKPKKLYVIADGPRGTVAGEVEKCNEVRALIDTLDWECEVKKRFSTENLGCGLNPAQGISWVFEEEKFAIILEDDCLPDASFFPFCDELLHKYKDNDKVMMISGNNHLLIQRDTSESYFFSKNTQTHGWATWKRAWGKYDYMMSDWPIVKAKLNLGNYLNDATYGKNWERSLDHAYNELKSKTKTSFWDYQWTYTCWKNNALNIIPNVNLVTNTGYGDDSTHTSDEYHPLANLRVDEMVFPLVHPKIFAQDLEADKILSKTVYGNRTIVERIIRKLKRIIKKL